MELIHLNSLLPQESLLQVFILIINNQLSSIIKFHINHKLPEMVLPEFHRKIGNLTNLNILWTEAIAETLVIMLQQLFLQIFGKGQSTPEWAKQEFLAVLL